MSFHKSFGKFLSSYFLIESCDTKLSCKVVEITVLFCEVDGITELFCEVDGIEVDVVSNVTN